MTRGKTWKLKLNPRVKDIIDGSGVRGLGLALEHTLGEANKKVPLEEDTLQRSGVVSVDEANLQGAISYDTVYAVRQHEVPMNHNDGRTHKYLENAINAEQDAMLEIIAKSIRKEI